MYSYSFLTRNSDGENLAFNDDDEDCASEFETLVQAYLRDVHYSSKRQAILSVVYAIFNAGLVALPFVAQQCGIPIYLFTVLFMAWTSGYTTSMIIKMANENGVRTMEDLAECAFGPFGYFIVCILQIVFSFSLMCVSLEVWTDISWLILEFYFPTRMIRYRPALVLAGSLIVLPFCMIARSMSSLRWSSYLTVLAIAAAFGSLFVDFFTNNIDSKELSDIQDLTKPKSMWWTTSLIMTFCFAYNQKVFTVYSCLRRRTSQRWAFVVQRAHIIIGALYSVFGVFGLLTNLSQHQQLEHLNFFLQDAGPSPTFFNVLRGVVGLGLLMTIPVDCLVTSTTCKRMYQRYVRFHRSASMQVGFGHGESPGGNRSRTGSRRLNSAALQAHGASALMSHIVEADPNGTPRKISTTVNVGPRAGSGRASIDSDVGTTGIAERLNWDEEGASVDLHPEDVLLRYAAQPQGRPRDKSLTSSKPHAVSFRVTYGAGGKELSDGTAGYTDTDSDVSGSCGKCLSDRNSGCDSGSGARLLADVVQGEPDDFTHPDDPRVPLGPLSPHEEEEAKDEHAGLMKQGLSSNEQDGAASVTRLSGLSLLIMQDPELQKQNNAPDPATLKQGEEGSVSAFEDSEGSAECPCDGLGVMPVLSSPPRRRSSSKHTPTLTSSKHVVGEVDTVGSGRVEDSETDRRSIGSSTSDQAFPRRNSLNDEASTDRRSVASVSSDGRRGSEIFPTRESFHNSEGALRISADKETREEDMLALMSPDGHRSARNRMSESSHGTRMHPRMASVGLVSDLPLSRWFAPSELLPVLLIWSLTVMVCLGFHRGGFLAAVLGPTSAAVMAFLVPSMMYFRLGLTTDYSAIPRCGFVPNQLYMYLIQFLGVAFLLANLAAFAYACVQRHHIMSMTS